MALKNKLNS